MIVVVIIAVIGAIAIPRLSRGSTGAADSALAGDLAVLRKAIDLYTAEHDGQLPTLYGITNQLIFYSDAAGNTAGNRTATCIYGPYLRSIPALPVGKNKGGTGIAPVGPFTLNNTYGWVYDPGTGTITANTAASELDSTGKRYILY